MLDALADSAFARGLAESQLLTAGLSAVHLLGFTLVMASGLLSGLRWLGIVLVERPVGDVMSAASKALVVGLGISVVTGFLLFAPRAPGAAANEFFRAKMLLLLAVVAFHRLARGRLAARAGARQTVAWVGVLGLVLHLALALSASAFILLE